MQLPVTCAALLNSNSGVVVQQSIVEHMTKSIMVADMEGTMTTPQEVISHWVNELSTWTPDVRREDRDAEPQTNS